MGTGSSELGVGKKTYFGFEDLDAWQESHLLAVEVYRVTRSFPQDEIFGITSQIRRAASSVSANIAEGFGRATVPDRLHFLSVARGSLLETKNFIYLAEKLDYLDHNKADELIQKTITCEKLIYGFRKSLKS